MDVTNVAIPMALLTITYAVSLRRSAALIGQYYDGNATEEEEDNDHVEGDEDLIPKPEPLGSGVPLTSLPRRNSAVTHSRHAGSRLESRQAHDRQTHHQVLFAHEKGLDKIPMDLDAA